MDSGTSAALSVREEIPSAAKASSPASATSALDALDVVKLAALGWLMEGKSIRAAAEEVGVSRDTLSRWIRRDVNFRAAYNAWRQELIESTRARLLRTAEAAAVTVHKAVQRRRPTGPQPPQAPGPRPLRHRRAYRPGPG